MSSTPSSGLRFGWFELGDTLAQVADARVFACVHVPAHRTYIVRLPTLPAGAADDVSSIQNTEIERARVVATIQLARQIYGEQYLASQGLSQGGSAPLTVQEYFGVLEGRYLVPVSAVYRRRGAVPFEHLLEFPSQLLTLMPFWENLWLLLTAETSLLAGGSITLEVWSERWRYLIAQSDLGRQLLASPPEGLSSRLMEVITSYVDDTGLGVGPAFDHSVVLRLMMAVVTGRLSSEQLQASLSCPFFRLNVTLHDLYYAVALNALLAPEPWLVQTPVEWLGPTAMSVPLIVEGLAQDPAEFPVDGEAFELCQPADVAELSRFLVILQDPERTVRPFLALERRPA